MKRIVNHFLILLAVGMTALACDIDGDDANSEPCADCLPCETCSGAGKAAQCVPLVLDAGRTCGDDGHVHQVDSCGNDQGIVAFCMVGQASCVESEIQPAICFCLHPWTGENCTECTGNWDVAELCTTCRNHWIDNSDDCGTCPAPWDGTQDCAVCLGNWDEASNCTECDAGFTGENCETPVVYVDQTVPVELADGRSWQSAFVTVQAGIDAAAQKAAELARPCHVWVAAGTYPPNLDTARTLTLKNGVELYGGFAGTEQHLNERNYKAHRTYFSGHHRNRVINAFNVDDIVLDGIVIEAGFETLPTRQEEEYAGGGIWADNARLTIQNCDFRHNDAMYGPAVDLSFGSEARIHQCRFYNNDGADSYYGDHAVRVAGAKLYISDSYFYDNSGAINVDHGSIEVDRCRFYHNRNSVMNIGQWDESTATIRDSLFFLNQIT